ncbi:hypothetical protein SAMN05216410_0416 [Sanguibacter gelidistatuariae]|uniref:Alkaline shock response membrane anchor protein AmaP n=1 Tax=Sanguibacter gelidistatuariae TaxID=1814289 RepID=A0A1G6GUG1_9MICO|nr:alkaline shock response membrane anchor protein AmaP [Sanguibacter gelidistatuariae]SDB84756.1 hypothetical protein SAMN05216410_0416 [Sanguibacter gelidistatuariae]
MSSRVNAANRADLTVVGLILVAGGAVGLVASFGGFGSDTAADEIFPESLRDLAADSWWFWPALAVVSLLVALVGLKWLLLQMRTDHLGELDLTDDQRDGITTLDASAITRALSGEVEGLPGVVSASGRLRDRGGPRFDLVVDLTRRADVAEIRSQLETQVVPHLRQALDDPGLPVVIQLRPGQNTSRDLS